MSSFQITAQINDIDRVSILHVNSSSMDPQTPTTVQVPENGEYLVTVHSFQDGIGILSGKEFSQIRNIVDDGPTTPGNSCSYYCNFAK